MDLIFKNTPFELVIKILEYDGSIKYRYGKFMNQICRDDKRYDLLGSISQFNPVFYSNYPIYYIRELGKYMVKLKIENYYTIPRFRYIFQKKREENDTSPIILYFYELT